MFMIYVISAVLLTGLALFFLPEIIRLTKSNYRNNVAAPVKVWFNEVVLALKS